VDVLGSKLEGAAWARARWPDPGLVDAAVALGRGADATLDESAVDALLSAVATRLREAAEACARPTSQRVRGDNWRLGSV
jgi:hypothetical protein